MPKLMHDIENMERRQFEVTAPVQVRSEGDTDDTMVLEGYALKFEAPATHKRGDTTDTETIKRGALDKCDMRDVPLRYNHNDSWLIMARTRNKSLKLTVDQTGLFIHAELIDTSTNRDLYKSVQAGLIDKMSFAFTIGKGGDAVTHSTDWSQVNRDITYIDKLYDVSVVDVPFYDATEVSARALEELDSVMEEAKRHAGQQELELRKRKAMALLNLESIISMEE